MTPSPLPPPDRSADVAAVMFGQPWTDPNGDTRIADADTIILTLLHDGHPAACLLQTPESAIALGQLLVQAAGTAIRNNITDDGRPAPLAERLARLNKGFTQ